MKYFREILIVVLLIIIGLLLTCNKPKVVTIDKVVTVIDTIPFPQKERVIKVPVVEYVPVSKTDTVTLVEYKDPHFKKYTQPFEDSLVKGEILNTVDGTLINTDFKYTPKFPKYIKETTTITKQTLLQKR